MRLRSVLASLVMSFGIALGLPTVAFAHAVVTPSETETGSRTTFSISVPNEEENAAVTKIRLVIPSGIEGATPTVKPGWTITTTKDSGTVSEITWQDGTIPVGQRDDFTFRAVNPAKPTDLAWKVYQTYDSGKVVSWDQKPTKDEHASDDEESTSGPYSVTKVVAELSASAAATSASDANTSNSSNAAMIALGVSLTALLVSIFGLIRGGKSQPSQQ